MSSGVFASIFGPGRGPFPVFTDQGIGEDEELSHDSNQGDPERLSGAPECGVDLAERRIAADRREGRHVERTAQAGPSAGNHRPAGPLPGLAHVRGETCECGNLPGRERAGLRHVGEDRHRRYRPDAGDRRENVEPPRQAVIVLDALMQFGVELGDLPADLAQPGFQLLPHEPGACILEAVGARRLVLDERRPGAAQLVQVPHGVAGRLDRLEIESGPHPREHGRIDRIGLGLQADGLGEPARSLRVDLDQAMAGPGESGLQIPVVTPRRRVDDTAGFRAEPAAEGLQPVGGVGKAGACPVRQAMGIKMVFRDVDADGSVHDLFVSRSCRYEAGAGAPPPVSVRVAKKAGVIILGNGSRPRAATILPPPLSGPMHQAGQRHLPIRCRQFSTDKRMQALLSGAIDMGALNVASGSKHLSSGALQGFAIAAPERAKQLPDMPTLQELGVDMTFALERGIVAPKGTPKEVVDMWSAVFKAAAENPDLMAQLDAKGTGLRYQNPEEFRAWAEGIFNDYKTVAIEIGMYKE